MPSVVRTVNYERDYFIQPNMAALFEIYKLQTSEHSHVCNGVNIETSESDSVVCDVTNCTLPYTVAMFETTTTCKLPNMASLP